MEQKELVDFLTDEETGLFQSTYFHLRLDEEFKKSIRYGWSYALVLLEVNGVEALGEAQGAGALQALWVQLGNVILTNSRDCDTPARISSTRLAVLLPGTEVEGAKIMVQRVMSDVLDQASDGISLDAGIVESPQVGLEDVSEFLARAERGVETAKGQGANQLVVWNSPSV